MKSDRSRYIPLLRWKRAERVALRYLHSNVRGVVTPIVELVPTVDNSPSKLTVEIKTNWGFAPFFLDFVNLSPVGIGNLLLNIDEAMRTHSLRPIPVTGLRRPSQYQTAVAHIAADRKVGLCVRLLPLDLSSPSLRYDLQNLLAILRLDPEQIDLVADYQLISEFSMPFAELCRRLPFVERWRTLTVLSGAFCEDLREYKKNGQYIRRRDDWLFFRSEVVGDLPRFPNFGDYSIQYGLYKEPPDWANVSASIRYAADEHWVITRGEGLMNDDSPGNAQYAAHAQLLCEREEYRGRDFSYGDKYIWNLNLGIEGPGNPETLLRAAINHHMSVVTDQLSSFVGTSVADALSLAQRSVQPSRTSDDRLGRVSYAVRNRPPQTR